MKEIKSLRNHLLIAMPQLEDTWFAGTVTYMCEHNQDGAMGVVLNRPLDFDFAEVCDQLEIPRLPSVNAEILCGGPVSQENGFILHREQGNWESTLNVTEQSHLTSSKDILEAIATGAGPRHYLLGLGYAGWSAQQLDKELRENSWITLEATPELIFETDIHDLYNIALSTLGISAEFLSSDAGHA